MDTNTLAVAALGTVCVTVVCIVAICRAERSDIPAVMCALPALAVAVLTREG
ncbi:hypothetical protein ACWGRL_21630 [[Kitasatospora] papulosa]